MLYLKRIKGREVKRMYEIIILDLISEKREKKTFYSLYQLEKFKKDIKKHKYKIIVSEFKIT